MPLFSDPTAPPGWLETRRLLGRYADLFLSLTGGAALAIALSTSSLATLPLALVAVATSLTAPRAPKLTAGLEVLFVSAAMALVHPAGHPWGWFGITCLLVARAWSTWRALCSQAAPPSSRWRVVASKPKVSHDHDDPSY